MQQERDREGRARRRDRRILRFAAALLLAWLAGCSSAQRPLHLVMIVVDTLRADALGLYGNPQGTTPEIDAFGRDSVVFDRAWAQGTYTPSSYMSYMSSTHVRTHGWDYHVAYYPEVGVCGWDDLEMLAEVLSRHGFQNEAFVANLRLHPKRGFARGFERWNGESVEELAGAEGPRRRSLPFHDGLVVEGARQALESWQPGRRHFLYLHLMAPHLPLTPSAAALKSLGLPEDWVPEGYISVQRMSQLRRGSTPQQRAQAREGYRASVWDADRFTGEILSAVAETGHQDDTIVVFLSDHGEEIWEHGDYGHSDGVWEQLAHVPLVIRVPGRKPGRVGDRAVALVDVAPTVLDLLGIEDRPESWQGQHLLESEPGRTVFTERLRVIGLTSDGRTKAIYGPENSWKPPWRYFDLERDPTEQHDLRSPEADRGLPERYREWYTRTPRVVRDLEAEPVGPCRTMSPRERQDQDEALRALGYLP